MKKRLLVILSIVLAIAGLGIFARTRVPSAPTPEPATDDPYLSVPGSANPCAYTWAYKDLPEIGAEFQAGARAVLPEAKAHATAFGENCVAADGSATFNAMETDFYLLSAVDDLYDNERLGEVVEKILVITDGFAPPRVPGRQAGFVEFTFWNGSEQRILRVPISEGKQFREQGLHGAQLLEAIETQ